MHIKLALASQNTENCFEHKIFGLNAGSSKAWKRFIDLSPDDILVFYKAKEGFAGIWKVVSEPYKDAKPSWEDDVYSNRVKIEPIVELKTNQYVNAKTMVNELEMITQPAYWETAFRENLKEISPKDYDLIKLKLEKAYRKGVPV